MSIKFKDCQEVFIEGSDEEFYDLHNTNHKKVKLLLHQNTDFLPPSSPLLEGAHKMDFLGESFSDMKRRMCNLCQVQYKQTHHGTVQW